MLLPLVKERKWAPEALLPQAASCFTGRIGCFSFNTGEVPSKTTALGLVALFIPCKVVSPCSILHIQSYWDMHASKMVSADEEPARVSGTVQESLTVQEPVALPAIVQQTAAPKEAFNISTSDCHDCTFLKGWRLYITTLGLMVCLYLVNVETTVVSTSLITIANGFHSFNRTSWIVTGYLITYTGFNILWSKLSDIIGRKASIIATMAVFMGFSLGCGMAKSMSQLSANSGSSGVLVYRSRLFHWPIDWRSFGRSLDLAMDFLHEVSAISVQQQLQNEKLIAGFNRSLPIGGVAVLLLMIALPSNFGGSGRRKTGRISWGNLRRIDVVGALILLTATLPLITALNEVYVQFRWSDGRTVILLAISGISWYAFLAWEHAMTREGPGPEPIFPSRFLNHANWMGMLLTSFLVGMPSNMVVVMLPQRFQIVNGTSALSSGVRLLAYSATSAISAGLSGIISKKARVPFVYSLAFGAILHTAGVALVSTLPETKDFPWGGYVYEGIAGAGVGTTFGILVLATPFVVEPRDIAVATGAVIQFRFLGGAIGLAIASNVLNGMLESDLTNVLSPTELQNLLHNTASIETLSEVQREAVVGVFAHSYTTQFRTMVGIAAVQFVSALFVWKRGGRQITALD
ncbi:hypothetical protein UA08_01090 [Talaromyces atroroseus]|uniref:Major facilitator superfamily (MFS) profile domain-containing protein n=1 Tax=Talaromyces atroroseus TaxID=1441469 RepID=A0A225B8V8_TALAT|nr:hypothetical protein UA08_01090 [Talaromyces atroroseus]OKL63826.1 hypothetical protein UA08_01090 [Talaromyces atroroseus]